MTKFTHKGKLVYLTSFLRTLEPTLGKNGWSSRFRKYITSDNYTVLKDDIEKEMFTLENPHFEGGMFAFAHEDLIIDLVLAGNRQYADLIDTTSLPVICKLVAEKQYILCEVETKLAVARERFESLSRDASVIDEDLFYFKQILKSVLDADMNMEAFKVETT